MKELILIIAALAIYDLLKMLLLIIMEANDKNEKKQREKHKSKFQERLDKAINKEA